METQESTQNTEKEETIVKSQAQRQKEYRQRKKEKGSIQNTDLVKERTVKTQAQRQKEYRLRKKEKESIQNTELVKEKIVKTQAQRQKEYRLRKKEKKSIQNKELEKETIVTSQTQKRYRLRKKLENPVEIKKRNAQYQKKFREKQKIKLLGKTLDPNLARKKVNSEDVERCRENEENSNKIILNLIKPAEVEIPLTTGFDYRSQMGQFGWASINNVHIPYIFRLESTKYVALRIINQVLFPKILSAFHQELFDLFPLRCYTMTDTERSLYNEINFIHTNGAYGLNSFQTGVQLVLLDDAIRLYNFLSHLHSKMFMFKPDHHTDFGYKTFLSPTHKVPFVKSNGTICYPMLYFEAEKGFLLQHSTTVDDFSTRILMVLMSIQSVHCSLDNFRVITQNVITKYFDPKHNVEDTWPIQMKPVFCNHSRSNDSNLKFTNADNPEEMAVALREMTHIRGMSYLKYFPGYERVAVVLKDNEKGQTISENNVENNVKVR